MQTVMRPWGAMHVRTRPGDGGRAAVFLNSLGTDMRMWDGVVGRIRGLGRTLQLDFRGHGLSAVAAESFAISDLVADVRAAMDAHGIDRAIIVGCSVGGMTAQMLALETPERVAALVLSNTTVQLGTPELWRERVSRVEADGLPSVAGDVIKRWFGAAMLERPEAALWRAMLERTPVAGYTALCRAIAAEEIAGRVGAIAAPCLVIGGSEDEATPPEDVRALAQAIPGAAHREIAGVGHLPAVEAPETFAEIASAFIERLPHE